MRAFYLGGLLEAGGLRRNLDSMTREYEIAHYASGDFDERLFINDFEQMGSPSKLPPASRHFYQFAPLPAGAAAAAATATAAGAGAVPAAAASASAHYSSANVPLSPSSPRGTARRTASPAAVPQTPLAATLDSVNWLEGMLHGRDVRPSAILSTFFAAASPDAAALAASIEVPFLFLLSHLLSSYALIFDLLCIYYSHSYYIFFFIFNFLRLLQGARAKAN